jgi:hypothetical protein
LNSSAFLGPVQVFGEPGGEECTNREAKGRKETERKKGILIEWKLK